MPRIGVYNVPFPYDPYPLQEDAVNKLSQFLRDDTVCAAPSASLACPASPSPATSANAAQEATGQKRGRQDATTRTAGSTLVPRMAVLESPTGTGKSQMLLNAVLAAEFELVEARPDASRTCTSTADSRHLERDGEEKDDKAGTDTAPSHTALSLDAMVAQQRLEDELQRVRHQRRQRVRAERRRLRLARQYMKDFLASEAAHATASAPASFELLLEQDPIQFLSENSPSLCQRLLARSGSGHGDGEHGGDFTLTSSSDSSDDGEGGGGRHKRKKNSADEIEEEIVDDEQVSQQLATLVPLRRPKIFFASRTHTQLNQLRGDFEATEFAHALVRRREHPTSTTRSSKISTQHGEERDGDGTAASTPRSPPRRIRAIHVAGRQQLCVNAHIRAHATRRSGGGRHYANEALNEACLDAIRYEYSAAGRAARRQDGLVNARHGSLLSSTAFSGILSGTAEDDAKALDSHKPASTSREGLAMSSPAWGDLEDLVGPASASRAANPTGSSSSSSHFTPGDVEDTTASKGCVFCGEERLRMLIQYIQQQQQQQEKEEEETRSRCARDCEEGLDTESVNETEPVDTKQEKKNKTSIFSLSLDALKKVGVELQACPYLATRLLVRGADVLFIPYGYLVDEAQRESLLRGVATNPATEEEKEKVEAEAEKPLGGVSEDMGWSGDRSTSGSTALGAVLYRRQRHIRDVKCGGSGTGGHTSGKITSTASRSAWSSASSSHSTVLATTARNAAPNFSGSTLVFDEAHNLADQCRSVSTAVVDTTDLHLVRALMSAYLMRYEKRLLIHSKQRLRELGLFLDAFVSGAARAIGDASAHTQSVAASSAPSTSAVVPFTKFVFAANVDHIDVFRFLAFLVDSRLFMKLQGMVAYVLEEEQAKAAAVSSASTRAAALAHYGRSKTGATVASVPLVPDTSTAPTLLTPLFATLMNTAAAGTAELTVAGCTSAAARALRRVEHFLKWCYVSSDSTRVVLTGATPGMSGANLQIKLIQLCPAMHTLLPVLRAARATILAGGTMQPLTLTCEPLLASDALESFLTAPPSSWSAPIHFIREGHVVPPSSVAVWALGTGPSGREMNFRQKARPPPPAKAAEGDVCGGGRLTASPPMASSLDALFSDLALTLLNVARVMPPAGMVCFFTSFDMEAAFTAFLQARAALYWEPLNAVKKVFREGALRQGDGGTIEELMSAYRDWIYGEGQTPLPTSPSSSGDRRERARRGALLFAVMGGRLSEGINFADDLGRVVVVVGMPFASPSDPELRLHLRHLAAASSAFSSFVSGDSIGESDGHVVKQTSQAWAAKPARTETTPSAARMLNTEEGRTTGDDVSVDAPFSPQEWSLYTDMCMRVVNQSIGRCIRHAEDHATILLLDSRYVERRDVRQRISTWLHPSVVVASAGFPQCIRGIKQFFDAHAKTK